jgi:amidase
MESKMNQSQPNTASQVAKAIRTGATSSFEVIESLVKRIDQYNPPLNAIITIDIDRARQRAQEADEAARRGEIWGPLHGVPMTIKDSFETAGMRTVSGYPPFAQNVPTADAPPVARLRQAGAIILGKTNLPTLASGIQTNNPVFGRTNNPLDLDRTPGGSSGGAAAAIAAQLSYLELGSDIGGSIRIPAHFCGVYGLKSTGGRVSGRGHLTSPKPLQIPSGWEALLQLGSMGPLARSVEDLRLAFQIIAEPGTANLEPPHVKPLQLLNIAWTDDFGGTPIDQDSAQQIQQFAQTLSAAGCKVEHQTDPGFDFEEAWWISGKCLGTIDTLFHSSVQQWLRRLSSPILTQFGARHPLLKGLYAGISLKERQVLETLKQRQALIDQIENFLSEWDVWICPVFPTPAFTHRPPNAPVEVDGKQVPQILANLQHSVIFNVSGHPAVVIPLGVTRHGLPVGVQLVGRRWHELVLLNAAEQIVAFTDGYQPPPGYRANLE